MLDSMTEDIEWKEEDRGRRRRGEERHPSKVETHGRAIAIDFSRWCRSQSSTRKSWTASRVEDRLCQGGAGSLLAIVPRAQANCPRLPLQNGPETTLRAWMRVEGWRRVRERNKTDCVVFIHAHSIRSCGICPESLNSRCYQIRTK